jgi:hypothetical protein
MYFLFDGTFIKNHNTDLAPSIVFKAIASQSIVKQVRIFFVILYFFFRGE